MLAATSYLRNARVFCILTILAAVFIISLRAALARTMRTFLVLSHLNSPCFPDQITDLNVSMVGLVYQMVKWIDDPELVSSIYNEHWPLK